MQNEKISFLPAAALIAGVIIAFGAYYVFFVKEEVPSDPSPQEGEGIDVPGLGTVYVNTPGVTIEPVAPVSDVPPRDFTIPLSSDGSLSLEAQAALKAQFKDVQNILSADKTNYKAWVRLGALRKTAGDYAGAAGDWEYVSKLYPGNLVSFGNLGNLYLDFLKDYPKAESNYRQQIANNSADEGAYSALFSLYTDYGYKTGTSAAEDILKAGIKAIPDSVSLHVLLARYYKAQGDIANATVQYDAAIAAARVAGNTQATIQLEAEKAAL